MKFTCKQCDQKCHIKKRKEINCDKVNCEIKYDMHGDTLDFKDFSPLHEAPNYLEQFVSAKPTYGTYNGQDMTEAEWYQLCMSGSGY